MKITDAMMFSMKIENQQRQQKKRKCFNANTVWKFENFKIHSIVWIRKYSRRERNSNNQSFMLIKSELFSELYAIHENLFVFPHSII